MELRIQFWGLGLRVSNLRFRVSCLGLMLYGLGLGALDLGFRIQGV